MQQVDTQQHLILECTYSPYYKHLSTQQHIFNEYYWPLVQKNMGDVHEIQLETTNGAQEHSLIFWKLPRLVINSCSSATTQ
jgi:hypothetical protein